MMKSLNILTFFLILSLQNIGVINAYEEKPVLMRTTAPYQELINTSFSIEKKNNNMYLPHGSGFYIRYDGVPYGITARHVVQDRSVNEKDELTWGEFIKPLFIRLHTEDESIPLQSRHKEISSFNNLQYQGLYNFHSNKSIDAVIFPVFFKQNLSEASLSLPYKFIQKDELVLIGEDVHIFGFPGPYGFKKGKSVIRSGTICLKLNKYVYLLDANTWPGDSGGMIVSKPYFGVPKDNEGTYQWQIGGKIIGLYIGRKNPEELKGFNLPKSLEAFRIVISGQALIEIIESNEFKESHKNWKKVWKKIKDNKQKKENNKDL
ncbi:MAG: trypsin-like peptidase domain-containing protein [bacterium]